MINKPPGMPVQVITSDFLFLCSFFMENLYPIIIVMQGGVGIKHSVDTLGAVSLKFDYSEPPRLVSLITE